MGILSSQRDIILRRALLLALACVLLVVLVATDAVHDAVVGLLAEAEQIISRNAVLGAVLFVVFTAAAAMFAFVSSALVVPVAVFAWGESVSVLLLWLGWLLGGVISYGIGRFPGRAMFRWMAAGDSLHRLEGRVGRNASFGLVLLLQLALPSEIPGYLLGLVRYSGWKYLLALALAELPYAMATIHMGAGFIERRSWQLLAMGLGLILMALLAFHLLGRRLVAESLESPEPAAGEAADRQ